MSDIVITHEQFTLTDLDLRLMSQGSLSITGADRQMAQEITRLRTALSEAEQRVKNVSVPETQNVTRLPQDVIDLVIAAREFWDILNDMEPESKALDNALEKFASRVPFEDEATSTVPAEAEERKNEAWDGWSFALGDYVCKKSGSWWAGRVAGFYTTEQTPRGYAVQLDKPFGPVQIYPESALERLIPSEPHDAEGRE